MGSPLSIRLPEDADRILSDATGDGGPSRPAWISQLIRAHRRRTVAALSVVHAAEWSNGAILCAMDALNGSWMLRPHASYLVIELHDAERVSGLATKWDVADEWPRCVAMARDDAHVAMAIKTLAESYWTGDAWLAAKLR